MLKYLLLTIIFSIPNLGFSESVNGNEIKEGDEISILQKKYPDIAQCPKEMYSAELTTIKEVGYTVAKIDLNNDGTNEILAEIHHPCFCGARGCMFVILQKSESGYTEILNVTADFPVQVNEQSQNGYKVLSFDIKKWVYSNGKYQ